MNWKIVGGGDKGGIIVRTGLDLKSAVCTERISTGAVVEQLVLVGERLKYRRLTGSGPDIGWVSRVLKDKVLCERTEEAPEGLSQKLFGTLASQGVVTYPCGLLFPGQGSQYVGMMNGVRGLQAVKEMLDKSRNILGYDILEKCLNGPDHLLDENRYWQPAVFIAGLAGREKLRMTHPEAADNPAFVAGLSLGEYAALSAAGVFSFEEGLKLVKLRGLAMQEAAAFGGNHYMLSVAGLEKSELEKLCLEAAKKEGPGAVCSISNVFFPKGFTCGGTEAAIRDVKEAAEKAQAFQVKLLRTDSAYHTELMQPAQHQLFAALDEALPRMKAPTITIYMNATAEPIFPGTPPEKIVENLKKQLTSPVLWEPSVSNMIKSGVQEYYECGPLRQITSIMKCIDVSTWKKTKALEV